MGSSKSAKKKDSPVVNAANENAENVAKNLQEPKDFTSKKNFVKPLESEPGGVASWQFILIVASISAAIYFGLQARSSHREPEKGRPPYPAGGPYQQGPYAPGHAGSYGNPVPPVPNGKVWAPKKDPTRKLEDVPKENGGWRPPSESDWNSFAVGHCDIVRKSAQELSPQKFEKEYRYKKPLILEFSNGADGWTSKNLWTLPSLLQSYGKWEVGSGRGVDIVRHGGNGHYRSTFEDYVMRIMEERDDHKEPFYMFDRNFYNQSGLPQSMHPPRYLSIHPVYDENIFFLGASMSGVSFHKHADAWNGVVFGWKRWFIYPPTQTPPGGVWPGLNTMEWFDRIYPKLTGDLKPLECMQGPGEIIYLPESWYHATINLGDTIAIGIQKNIGALYMENMTYENNHVEDDPKLEPHVKLDKAFKIWTDLHAKYPTNAEITNRLGENYAARGDFKNGIAACLRAVEQDPYFLVAHVNLGKMYFSIGDPESANKHFLKAVEINPTNSDVCWIYGEFLVFRRRVEEAIQWFEKGGRDHIDKKDFFDNLVNQARDLLRMDPELKSIPTQRPKMMDHSFS